MSTRCHGKISNEQLAISNSGVGLRRRICFMPPKAARRVAPITTKYRRQAPLKAHTAWRTAHSYSTNVAPRRPPKRRSLTSARLMSFSTNDTQKEP